MGNRGLIFLFIVGLFIIPFIQAPSVNIPQPAIQTGGNYSINVNTSNNWNTNIGVLSGVNSTQFENSGGLLHAVQSWWDGLYCQLTGCTMQDDIDMDGNDILDAGNVEADYFIGDGSQLTNISYGMYESFVDGTSTTAYYTIASVPLDAVSGQNLRLNVKSWTDAGTVTATFIDVAVGTKASSLTSTVPSIISTTGHSYNSDTTAENGYVIRNARISANATHWNIDIQKYKATTIYFRVVPINPSNYTFYTGNLTLRTAGSVPRTTSLTQGFSGDNVAANSASTSTYSSYIEGGATLSNTADKTGQWEYFGSMTLTYSSSYLGGHTYNTKVYLQEQSAFGFKNASQLEVIDLDLKVVQPNFTNSAGFNEVAPSIAVDVKGNTTLTGDDFACLTYSNSTATKVVRCYVKLKDRDTNYKTLNLNRYGRRFTTTGSGTTDSGFSYASTQAVIVSLPTPSQGDIAYGTKIDYMVTDGSNAQSLVTLNNLKINGQQVINFTNDDYVNTNGENSHLLMDNTDGSQNVVSSMINGVMMAKWRTDNAGNINWVTYATDPDRGHYFYTGGDYGDGGTMRMLIFNALTALNPYDTNPILMGMDTPYNTDRLQVNGNATFGDLLYSSNGGTVEIEDGHITFNSADDTNVVINAPSMTERTAFNFETTYSEVYGRFKDSVSEAYMGIRNGQFFLQSDNGVGNVRIENFGGGLGGLDALSSRVGDIDSGFYVENAYDGSGTVNKLITNGGYAVSSYEPYGDSARAFIFGYYPTEFTSLGYDQAYEGFNSGTGITIKNNGTGLINHQAGMNTFNGSINITGNQQTGNVTITDGDRLTMFGTITNGDGVKARIGNTSNPAEVRLQQMNNYMIDNRILNGTMTQVYSNPSKTMIYNFITEKAVNTITNHTSNYILGTFTKSGITNIVNSRSTWNVTGTKTLALVSTGIDNQVMGIGSASNKQKLYGNVSYSAIGLKNTVDTYDALYDGQNQSAIGIDLYVNNGASENVTNAKTYGLYFRGLSSVITTIPTYGIYMGATGTYIKNRLANDNQITEFGNDGDFYISYDGTNAIFNTSAVGTGLAYFSNNVSATGFVTRTEVYDKSTGTALNKIKDASELYTTKTDSKGQLVTEINHSAFYGYAPFNVTDMSKPETKVIEEEICEQDEKGKVTCRIESRSEVYYPHKKLEEGVNIVSEIELLRQSLYELKFETCQKDKSKWSWCNSDGTIK